MKLNFRLFLLLFTCGIVIGNAQKGGDKKIIILDPGHGGKDSGAISINGVKEKDIVLDIAKQVLWVNRNLFNSEFEIYLTRYTDTLVSLSDRSKLGKALKPYAFISLHCNHAKNANAKGMEVFIHTSNNNRNAIEQREAALAMEFLTMAQNKLGFESRGVKRANFQVLRDAIGHYAAMLLELGFLSQENEARYLSNPKHRSALALSIIMAINRLTMSMEAKTLYQ